MHGDPNVLQLSPGSKMLEDPDDCSGVILMAVFGCDVMLFYFIVSKKICGSGDSNPRPCACFTMFLPLG